MKRKKIVTRKILEREKALEKEEENTREIVLDGLRDNGLGKYFITIKSDHLDFY